MAIEFRYVQTTFFDLNFIIFYEIVVIATSTRGTIFLMKLSLHISIKHYYHFSVIEQSINLKFMSKTQNLSPSTKRRYIHKFIFR